MIGPLMLDGVLRSHHHERGHEMIGLTVNRDLPLFHDLEQGRLRLGGGPVDLVDEYDIAEDRSMFELENC